jgi:predicted anti-sigma-YlaC factor YlaD
MNCHESLDWLQSRLDGEMLPAPNGLEQHLSDCALCRPQHQAAQALLEGLHGLKRLAPPEKLSDLIVARVLADRQARRIRWRRRVTTTVALAASLLLAALAGYLWLPVSKNDGRDKLVDVKKAPERQEAPEIVATGAPSLTRSVEEARLAVAALTEKIADKSKEQARLWWPLDVAGLPEVKLDPPLDPAAQSLRQTGQGMSEGLQTVAQSARRAVSYFLRELPPLEMPKSGS